MSHADRRPMTVLFVKHTLSYPRQAGHDIRAYNLMRSLADLGHTVALLTVETPTADAVGGLTLAFQGRVADHVSDATSPSSLSYLQGRFHSYFGVSVADAATVAQVARTCAADAVVGVGADILPYLSAVTGCTRVWYAGDEWVSHYASLARATQPSSWSALKTAAIWGLYERSFAPLIDRTWVVSTREQGAMQRWGGMRRVDVLANGVDADFFSPQVEESLPESAVFWGRLDFIPNQQGLEWFCTQVWPLVRARWPRAVFRIIGFKPTESVLALGQIEGVTVEPDLPDLRAAVGAHAVVVMPFKSGGGVKNKVLEAASLAKPIVCTQFACNGLRSAPPVVVAEDAAAWVDALHRLWTDIPGRLEMGQQAREWVLREHSWRRTATDAVASLEAQD